MVSNLQGRSDTKTLGEMVPLDRARRIMETGMVREGDVIAYWKDGRYQHMAVRVEADGISCHTASRYDGEPFGETWELLPNNYLYTFIHFSADDPTPSGNMQAANGWWIASTPGREWFYYIFPDGRVRWIDRKPVMSGPPPLDLNRSGYWFDTGGTLLITWRATGSVEEYDFPLVASSYKGVWHYGATDTRISMERLI